MPKPLRLHPERLLPPEPATRAIALRLYQQVAGLPIISPHGHTDPAWFADNSPFANATSLLLQPDHYLYRMLYSHGISLDQLGIAREDGSSADVDPREAWRLFASHYYLFRGTPSRLWLDHVFAEVFGLEQQLDADTADLYFDSITEALQSDAFLPRALYERFNIEVLTTTESPLEDLEYHRAIRDSGWQGRVLSAFRPDPVVDPESEGFLDNLQQLGDITGEDTGTWQGYLKALRQRRQYFKDMGATSTDHGHPTAATADLSPNDCQALYDKALRGKCKGNKAELFRGQLITEMAAMSLDDGLVMQLHPGALRNHNLAIYQRFGRDRGGDLPSRTDFVNALKPLLDRFGNEKDLCLILFSLDESSYARELAPLAGHYPCLKLGPAWWFHDSPEGMRRYRQQMTETAGFYNTVGFNDDTRAFLSIPARHDVARRMDCGFLAELVADHRLEEDEAAEIAQDLAYALAKRAYRL